MTRFEDIARSVCFIHHTRLYASAHASLHDCACASVGVRALCHARPRSSALCHVVSTPVKSNAQKCLNHLVCAVIFLPLASCHVGSTPVRGACVCACVEKVDKVVMPHPCTARQCGTISIGPKHAGDGVVTKLWTRNGRKTQRKFHP